MQGDGLPTATGPPPQVYLEEYMQPDQLDGELQLAPGFFSPPNTDMVGYHAYIDQVNISPWGLGILYLIFN